MGCGGVRLESGRHVSLSKDGDKGLEQEEENSGDKLAGFAICLEGWADGIC